MEGMRCHVTCLLDLLLWHVVAFCTGFTYMHSRFRWKVLSLRRILPIVRKDIRLKTGINRPVGSKELELARPLLPQPEAALRQRESPPLELYTSSPRFSPSSLSNPTPAGALLIPLPTIKSDMVDPAFPSRAIEELLHHRRSRNGLHDLPNHLPLVGEGDVQLERSGLGLDMLFCHGCGGEVEDFEGTDAQFDEASEGAAEVG